MLRAIASCGPGTKSRSFHRLREAEVYSAIVDTPIDVPRIVERVSSSANGGTLRARAPSWSMREKTDERDAARSVWPEHRISPHLRHGSLQLSLLVLHAGRRSHLAAEDGHPQLRRDHERRRAARAARLAP